VVYVVAVAFAAFSLRLKAMPAAPEFLYGCERITFFSAGFEGAMIILAGIATLEAAIHKWIVGLPGETLGMGVRSPLAAGVLNATLGYYLLRVGCRTRSLNLEAGGGKDVLTDRWTGFGLVAGLGLVLVTRWKPFDPLIAIAVALNTLWSGAHPVAESRVRD
jgi:divalent metal cation (Fe/Co/Zn/Cd) transporter